MNNGINAIAGGLDRVGEVAVKWTVGFLLTEREEGDGHVVRPVKRFEQGNDISNGVDGCDFDICKCSRFAMLFIACLVELSPIILQI